MIRREDVEESFLWRIEVAVVQTKCAQRGTVDGVVNAGRWIIMVKIKKKSNGKSNSENRSGACTEPIRAFARGECHVHQY